MYLTYIIKYGGTIGDSTSHHFITDDIEKVEKWVDNYIKEFKEKHDWCVDDVYACKNNTLLIQFIYPHSGTDYKYCLRADFPETFDRWSVCLFEELFNHDEFNEVVRKLDEFVRDRDNIIKKEMELHPELFDENYN